MDKQLAQFKKAFPMPRKNPGLALRNRRLVRISILHPLIRHHVKNARFILELGAFLGHCTRYFIRMNPEVLVAAVDLWDIGIFSSTFKKLVIH